ncbi:hypothetical protein ACFW5W_07095 [Streptomyces sp. NPDC058783]|uniref:hypothetical protein n=1 Tax=Streptomyces sp. NPDC058783 TaxID=3346633 RepID=UPI0036D1F5DD
MKTYAVRGARTKLTGHYRRPGARDLYCNRPAGTINDFARGMARFKMCTRCVKAEARDRAEATATAEAWLDDQPAPELGTWRAEWIGARATNPEPTLFDMTPDAEQGALFA